jgi:hypothetical protein
MWGGRAHCAWSLYIRLATRRLLYRNNSASPATYGCENAKCGRAPTYCILNVTRVIHLYKHAVEESIKMHKIKLIYVPATMPFVQQTFPPMCTLATTYQTVLFPFSSLAEFQEPCRLAFQLHPWRTMRSSGAIL